MARLGHGLPFRLAFQMTWHFILPYSASAIGRFTGTVTSDCRSINNLSTGSFVRTCDDVVGECPLPENRQRHGSDLDTSGEHGGITITALGRGGTACFLPGSFRRETLQTGHVECCFSQMSMQATWKSWPQ
ncbi:hypothetical protein CFC21_061274 [Triticum aestivum]|uniref:Secreted protein n=2 Tax=Triticum aestivum TaxID=4565 RepID=A0A9R1GTD1_WHEAT|nr:hypothetical protein CFC21_061274 [Triticum aestivum]